MANMITWSVIGGKRKWSMNKIFAFQFVPHLIDIDKYQGFIGVIFQPGIIVFKADHIIIGNF